MNTRESMRNTKHKNTNDPQFGVLRVSVLDRFYCTHIKGRLLKHALILIQLHPFPNGDFSQKNEFAPEGVKCSPL